MLKVSLLGVVLLLLCLAITMQTHYQAHDADTRLYADMVADLKQHPLKVWCAPEWAGHWHRHGLFFEHPPGLLWFAAALANSFGLSTLQALYAVNFICMLLGLIGLHAIAGYFGGQVLAGLTLWLWIATPAFLQYLVRGNHEHPVACATLLGLWALVVPQKKLHVALAFGMALALGGMIKGLLILALLPIAFIYLSQVPSRRDIWLALCGGVVGAVVVWGLFELWFFGQTGFSFWHGYLQNQVRMSVGHQSSVGQKFINLLYYMARPLWFAWPLWLIWLYSLSQRHLQVEFKDWRAWLSGISGNQPKLLGLIVWLVFVGGFSLADRKADRYLFSMYPTLALATAAALQQVKTPWLQKLQAYIQQRPQTIYAGLAMVIVVCVGIKVYWGTHAYVFIRWWPGA